MNEATKLKALLTDEEWTWFQGEGIDIGCGPDPILPGVRRFDMEHGDANVITRHVAETFDFVFSSHCLEHMHDPRAALAEWWKLVRPGGRLIFVVPDEDLYEQGVFPSRFNSDHKATFTLSKRRSWSARSVNVLDLARGLPGAEILKLELHDLNYDRRLLTFGPRPEHRPPPAFLVWLYLGAARRLGRRWPAFEKRLAPTEAVDQTLEPDRTAQIFCALRKSSPVPNP
jgi:SAM-dependent methyltransferase